MTIGHQDPWQKWSSLQNTQDELWRIKLDVQVKLLARALDIDHIHNAISVALNKAHDELIVVPQNQRSNGVSSS